MASPTRNADRVNPSPDRATRPDSHPTIILAVLCIAQLMLIVDVVVVNVALPSIKSSLGISNGQVQFTSIAYTLIFGSLLIVAGRAGDLFGRRRLVLIGICIFTLASLFSGFAGTAWQLFGARALQGLGAALVSPNALALMTSTFPEGDTRNRAFGYWAAVGSGGAVAGQLLGGVLTDLAGWRSIFLINVPVGLIAIVAALRFLPESRSAERPRIDLWGALTLAGALASLTFALSRLAEQKLDIVLGAAIASALTLALAFVAIEHRHRAPLVRFQLLRNASVRAGNIVLALNAGALVGTLFFTTLYLQLVLGYSPLAVGFGFAPVTVIVLLVSPLAGRLVSRVGTRRLLAIGSVLGVAGMVYLAGVPSDGSYLGNVLPGLALMALGSGLSYAPTFAAGTAGVAEQDQGLASGLLNTSQEIGSAIGLALLASLALLIASDGEGAGTLTGYRAGFIFAAALQLLAFAAALSLPKERDETGQAV